MQKMYIRMRIPHTVTRIDRARTAFLPALRTLSGGRISSKERIFFVKQLAVMTAAGVPLVESLRSVREQGGTGALTEMLDSLLHDVQHGKTLASAMEKFPATFGGFVTGVVAIGERSGMLSKNLSYLADELKKKQLLKRKVMSAFIYPLTITIATLALTIFLVLYVFPKLTPIFTSLRVELPLSTRIVMNVSSFLQEYGLYVAFVAFISVCTLILLPKRYPAFDRFLALVLMRTAFLKSCAQHYYSAQSLRSLGLLLRSGMPLADALGLLSVLTGNCLYRDAFGKMEEGINRGERLSSHLNAHSLLFGRSASHMVAAGERGGDLSGALLFVADAHEIEFDEYTKTLSTMIEPCLMICMGLLIGLVAVSIITPIYGLTSHLHG